MIFNIGDLVLVPYTNWGLVDSHPKNKEIKGWKTGIIFMQKELCVVKTRWNTIFPQFDTLLALPRGSMSSWSPDQGWQIKPFMLRQFGFFFTQEINLSPTHIKYDF